MTAIDNAVIGVTGIFPIGTADDDSRSVSQHSTVIRPRRHFNSLTGVQVSQLRCLNVRSLSHPEIPHLGRCFRGAFVPRVLRRQGFL